MPTPELIDYVRDILSRGYSQEEVRKGLLRSGYAAGEVDEVLSLFPKPLSFGQRWKLALTSPHGLFAQIKDERGIGHALSFLLCIATIAAFLFVVPFFIGVALYFPDWLPSFVYGQNLALMAVVVFFVFIVQCAISTFVNAGVLHVFARLFGGKGSYDQAFKAVAYAQAWWIPGSFLLVIPFLGLFAFSVSVLFVEMVGIGALYGLSRGRSALAILSPAIIIAVVGFVMSGAVVHLPQLPSAGQAITSREFCTQNGAEWCYNGTQGNGCGSKDDCLAYVAVDLESAEACELITDSARRDICYGVLAINLQDISLCKKATDTAECEKFFGMIGKTA